jgi:glycosyltransferase involved in cell wall biosynthesis
MNTKRVCILAPPLERKDGISRVISEFAWHLKDKVIILTPRYKPHFTYKISDQTEIFEIKSGAFSGMAGFPFFLLIGSWKVAKLLHQKREITVINSHGIHLGILASIIKFLLFKRKLRNSVFIYDKEELTPSLDKNRIKRFKKGLYLLLTRLLLKFGIIDEVLVLDNAMAQLTQRVLNTNRVKVIRIGVCHSIVKLSKIKELKPSEKLEKILKKKTGIKLFFHGILIPRRRVEDLLIAFSLLTKNNKANINLYISGSFRYNPQYVNFIYRMVEDLHLTDQVYFLGELSEKELAYMYRICDIFIFPAHNQTWGLAPLEAMVFSKPVIVSTGCGVSEVLNKNVAILIPPKEPASIKEALLLLINNKNFREKLGFNAQNFVLKTLTFANTTNELKKLWKIDD